MTEVPKIVRERLRIAELGRGSAQEHPEADVLTAFAEQALSQADRESVLGHLAVCAECREVIALAVRVPEAMPQGAETATETIATEAVREPVLLRPHRNWFAWANLRWAALAAGVAVAIFAVQLGLEHHGKPAGPVAVAKRADTSSASAGPAAQFASQPMPERSVQANAKAGEAKSNGLPASAKPASRMLAGRVGALAADKPAARVATPGKEETAPVVNSPASGAPGSANETVEVSTTSQEVSTLFGSDMVAQGQALSIERAKPALDETAAGEAVKKDAAAGRGPSASRASGMFATQAALPSAPTLKQGTAWAISAGVLQRSLDGGLTWQTALKGEHSWLCYATRGQEVWAGGSAGALQHSDDGGASWKEIAVSTQGQSLASDVIQIDLQDPAGIALTTANHQTWSSADDGKTWTKK